MEAGELAGGAAAQFRVLAAERGTTPSTVSHAYRRLAQAGVIILGERRRATVAADGEFAAKRLLGSERPFRLAGSDDPALDVVLRRAGKSVVSVGTRGSFQGLTALWRGTADGAAIHLLHRSGVYNAPFARALLRDRQPCLIHLWRREKGLLVPPGNPRRITGPGDSGASRSRSESSERAPVFCSTVCSPTPTSPRPQCPAPLPDLIWRLPSRSLQASQTPGWASACCGHGARPRLRFARLGELRRRAQRRCAGGRRAVDRRAGRALSARLDRRAGWVRRGSDRHHRDPEVTLRRLVQVGPVAVHTTQASVIRQRARRTGCRRRGRVVRAGGGWPPQAGVAASALLCNHQRGLQPQEQGPRASQARPNRDAGSRGSRR